HFGIPAFLGRRPSIYKTVLAFAVSKKLAGRDLSGLVQPALVWCSSNKQRRFAVFDRLIHAVVRPADIVRNVTHARQRLWKERFHCCSSTTRLITASGLK